jgi:hypothetical protein
MEQLNVVRDFLRTNPLFSTSVATLRHRPFEFPDAPGDRGTLEEASATKPRKRLLHAIVFGGLLLSLFGTVWEYFLWRHDLLEKSGQSSHVFTLDSLGRFVLHLLSISPRTLKEQLVHGTPILCMAVGLFFLLSAYFFRIPEVPAHRADPLFARLLQQTLCSDSAPSDSDVQSLLANVHCRKIFQRAVLTVFPLKINAVVNEQVLRFDAMERDTSSISPEWNHFVVRLLDTLNKHKPFVHFIENHPGIPAEILYPNGLQDLLEYGTRQLIFTEMLGDPDCVFLYGNTLGLSREMFHWIRTAQEKNVHAFLPQTEKPLRPRQNEILTGITQPTLAEEWSQTLEQALK